MHAGYSTDSFISEVSERPLWLPMQERCSSWVSCSLSVYLKCPKNFSWKRWHFEHLCEHLDPCRYIHLPCFICCTTWAVAVPRSHAFHQGNIDGLSILWQYQPLCRQVAPHIQIDSQTTPAQNSMQLRWGMLLLLGLWRKVGHDHGAVCCTLNLLHSNSVEGGLPTWWISTAAQWSFHSRIVNGQGVLPSLLWMYSRDGCNLTILLKRKRDFNQISTLKWGSNLTRDYISIRFQSFPGADRFLLLFHFFQTVIMNKLSKEKQKNLRRCKAEPDHTPDCETWMALSKPGLTSPSLLHPLVAVAQQETGVLLSQK